MSFLSNSWIRIYTVSHWFTMIWTKKNAIGWVRTWENVLLYECAQEDSKQPAHLIRVFFYRMKNVCILGFVKCLCKLWSDRANAQSNLILRWPHVSEGTFSEFEAQIHLFKKDLNDKSSSEALSGNVECHFWHGYCVKLHKSWTSLLIYSQLL